MYDECWLAVRVRTGSNYSMSQYFCHTEQQQHPALRCTAEGGHADTGAELHFRAQHF